MSSGPQWYYDRLEEREIKKKVPRKSRGPTKLQKAHKDLRVAMKQLEAVEKQYIKLSHKIYKLRCIIIEGE